MGAREFDYYIFIDYSENLIGYIIVNKNNKDGMIDLFILFDLLKIYLMQFGEFEFGET